MLKSNDVKYSCYLAVLIFIAVLVLKGIFTGKEILKAVSTAVTITTILRYGFLKWGWKWKCLSLAEKIHHVPLLEGKWVGNFSSTWKESDDSTNASGTVEVTIFQPDLYTIKVTQRSGESISHSYCESFELLPDNSFVLNFSYRNEPNALVRDRSAMNYGTARYELHRDGDQKKLTGNYFTDRRSTGKVDLQFKL